jgi:2-keto-myo-inositol isomerase
MNRRTFLQSTVAAGAAITATHTPAAAQAAALPAKNYQRGVSPWPICLNTSTIRPATMDQKIEAAAKAGYDGMELWISDLEKHEEDGGSVSDLGKKIADHGLFVIDVIGLWGCMPQPEEEWEKQQEQNRNRMRLCAEVGSRHVAVLPLPDREDFDMRWATDRYRDLLLMGLNDYGINPAFEFVGFFKGVNRLGQAAMAAIDADHPQARIIPDTFHLYRGGSGFEGIQHLNGQFLAVFHWNDVPDSPPQDELKDEHRIYPGDGILPLEKLLRDLHAIGATCPLSLEMFNREHWEQDPNEVAATALRKVTEQITRALG